jgi:hypothetical protein
LLLLTACRPDAASRRLRTTIFRPFRVCGCRFRTAFEADFLRPVFCGCTREVATRWGELRRLIRIFLFDFFLIRIRRIGSSVGGDTLKRAKSMYKMGVVFVGRGQIPCGTVLVRRGQKLSEGFSYLLPTTQKKLTDAVYRAWADFAPILRRESLTHTEGIQLLRQFGLPISFILQTDSGKALFPGGAPSPKTVEQRLASIDTEEKLEAFWLQQPEPSPEELQKLLTFINSLVPGVRTLLTESVKELPHDRGGRPKEITSTEEQQQVRKEVKGLRGPGAKLNDIFAKVGRRHGVSASKIKQIWYEHGESDSDDQKRPKEEVRSAKPPVPPKKR